MLIKFTLTIMEYYTIGVVDIHMRTAVSFYISMNTYISLLITIPWFERTSQIFLGHSCQIPVTEMACKLEVMR